MPPPSTERRKIGGASLAGTEMPRGRWREAEEEGPPASPACSASSSRNGEKNASCCWEDDDAGSSMPMPSTGEDCWCRAANAVAGCELHAIRRLGKGLAGPLPLLCVVTSPPWLSRIAAEKVQRCLCRSMLRQVLRSLLTRKGWFEESKRYREGMVSWPRWREAEEEGPPASPACSASSSRNGEKNASCCWEDDDARSSMPMPSTGEDCWCRAANAVAGCELHAIRRLGKGLAGPLPLLCVVTSPPWLSRIAAEKVQRCLCRSMLRQVLRSCYGGRLVRGRVTEYREGMVSGRYFRMTRRGGMKRRDERETRVEELAAEYLPSQYGNSYFCHPLGY
nr:hypothetical protein Iba_chr09dCG12660 [Ipomoea batatas]